MELNEKVIWYRVTDLKFYTDKDIRVRLEAAYQNQAALVIKIIRLRDLLQEPVAMLKLDIEN